jgi:hypothetical protein
MRPDAAARDTARLIRIGRSKPPQCGTNIPGGTLPNRREAVTEEELRQ